MRGTAYPIMKNAIKKCFELNLDPEEMFKKCLESEKKNWEKRQEILKKQKKLLLEKCRQK